MSTKDQIKLLSLQVKDYRERLYQEETMRSKTFMELENLEAEYCKMEAERNHFRQALQIKEQECNDLAKELDSFRFQQEQNQFYHKQTTAASLKSPIPSKKAVEDRMFDSINDLSDLKNELDSVCKLPSDQKDRMLSDIQLKLTELLETKQEQVLQTQEVLVENQKLKDSLLTSQTKILDLETQLKLLRTDNTRLSEEISHLKESMKEQKRKRRECENETIKSKAKVEQLQEVVKMLSHQEAKQPEQTLDHFRTIDHIPQASMAEESKWLEEFIQDAARHPQQNDVIEEEESELFLQDDQRMGNVELPMKLIQKDFNDNVKPINSSRVPVERKSDYQRYQSGTSRLSKEVKFKQHSPQNYQSTNSMNNYLFGNSKSTFPTQNCKTRNQDRNNSNNLPTNKSNNQGLGLSKSKTFANLKQRLKSDDGDVLTTNGSDALLNNLAIRQSVIGNFLIDKVEEKIKQKQQIKSPVFDKQSYVFPTLYMRANNTYLSAALQQQQQQQHLSRKDSDQ